MRARLAAAQMRAHAGDVSRRAELQRCSLQPDMLEPDPAIGRQRVRRSGNLPEPCHAPGPRPESAADDLRGRMRRRCWRPDCWSQVATHYTTHSCAAQPCPSATRAGEPKQRQPRHGWPAWRPAWSCRTTARCKGIKDLAKACLHTPRSIHLPTKTSGGHIVLLFARRAPAIFPATIVDVAAGDAWCSTFLYTDSERSPTHRSTTAHPHPVVVCLSVCLFVSFLFRSLCLLLPLVVDRDDSRPRHWYTAPLQ